jgi:DNA-binding MarR family transcriptional regulator
MQESDVKTLERTGLTHAQAIIYLTLLELGQTKIGTIIEKTALQSSVVHNNINKLIDAGLVSFVLLGKIRQYQVADPAVFLSYLDKQKDAIEENKTAISGLMPRLRLIRAHARSKTDVEVFRGKHGFQTAFLEEYAHVESGETVRFLALPLEYHQDVVLEELFQSVNRLAIEKTCKFQGIGPKRVRSIWDRYYPDRKTYSFRYIDEDFPWDVNIFEDCILISIWGDDPVLIRIRNTRFRDNALRYFTQKWNQAKK